MMMVNSEGNIEMFGDNLHRSSGYVGDEQQLARQCAGSKSDSGKASYTGGVRSYVDLLASAFDLYCSD